MKQLRILLSAYACEPGRGSEPGVGWTWALALARRGHEVWVITRANNRAAVEQGVSSLNDSVRARLHFIYYDLPAWAKWWKKGHRGVHLYYLLWQWGAYKLARDWHNNIKFDLVHHVTFVTARQPSFMGNLGVPFIFGPAAGGERSPWRLRVGYSMHGWIHDSLRDLVNRLIVLDPLLRRNYLQAEHIYVTTLESLILVPRCYHHKTSVQLAIAIEVSDHASGGADQRRIANTSRPRILYVGHFFSWKGVHLALRAFAQFVQTVPDARFTIVGMGVEDARLHRLANTLGINSRIDWHNWLPQSQLAQLYSTHDIFFFPSLRDSGGMVVMEAMAHGLPVVCLDLGGPGVLVDSSCGRVIDVTRVSVDVVVRRLSDSLIDLVTTPELFQKLAQGAVSRVSAYSADALAEHVYGLIDSGHKCEEERFEAM